jgi:hypothetical protein
MIFGDSILYLVKVKTTQGHVWVKVGEMNDKSNSLIGVSKSDKSIVKAVKKDSVWEQV